MEKNESLENTVEDDVTRCRPLFCFRTQWADKLRTPKIFLVMYGVLNIVQGMVFAYFVGAMTSFEAHFQMKSEALGTVMSVGELTPVFTSLLFSHFIGKGDRPRWMALCMSFVGIGSFTITLPYYIYGVPEREYGGGDSTNSSNLPSLSLCILDSVIPQRNLSDNITGCETTSSHGVGRYAFVLYLLGYTIANNGNVLFYVVGTSYMDDNIQQKNSPLYLALASALRAIGPLIGFSLSTACLSYYVNPFEESPVPPSDPRWIGAWWIGYLALGSLALLSAALVAQFPIRLPSRHDTPALEMAAMISAQVKGSPVDEQKSFLTKIMSSVKDIIPSVRRIMTNVPFLLRMLSDVFTWIALDGLLIYFPKYIEHQFHIAKYEASMWTGIAFIAPTAAATLAVGYMVQRWRPTARQLVMSLIGSKAIYCVCLLILMALQCENSYIIGSEVAGRIPECELDCVCSSVLYSPICGSNGRNYMSPCHAGCSVVNLNTKNLTEISSESHWIYENCSCISDGFATSNLCTEKCWLFGAYIAVAILGNIFTAVEVIGALIFVLRCILVQDKAMSMGIFTAVTCVLCFIPGPLIFAALVDSTCAIWSSSCGEQGSCNIYDIDMFRFLYHGVPCACLLASTFVEIGLWSQSDKVVLFKEECDESTSKKQSYSNKIEMD